MQVGELQRKLEGKDPSMEVILPRGGEFDGYLVAEGAWPVTVCRHPSAAAHWAPDGPLIDPAERDRLIEREQNWGDNGESQAPEPRVCLLIGSPWDIPRADADRLMGVSE